MRLKLSHLLLSSALAGAAVLGLSVALAPPLAPVAQAQALPAEVDVDALLKLLPADKVKASYESKSFDSASGVTTVKNLRFEDIANPAANNVVFAEVRLRGLDMAAINSVFDFAKYGPTRDETFKALWGDVAVTGIVLTADGKPAFTIDSLTAGGVQMKQLAVTPPAPGAPEPDAIKFFGAFMDALIAGPIEVKGFKVDAPGPQPVSMSLAQLSFGGYTRGQLAPSSMTGMEMKTPDGAMKIESSTGGAADFSKVIPWMIKAELPPVGPEALLFIGASETRGVSFESPQGSFTIGTYSIADVNFYWLMPSSLKVAIADMIFTPAADAASEFSELGLSKLTIGMGLDWSFDGNASTARLGELRLDIAELFNAKLNLDIVNFKLADLVNPATMQMAATLIGISSGDFVFKNNGGFEKILTVQAKQQGTTPDALKAQMTGMLDAMSAGAPGPDGNPVPLTERMASIIAALKSYIANPGTLTITMRPPAPVNAMTGMGAMMNPMGAADALGITVTATP